MPSVFIKVCASVLNLELDCLKPMIHFKKKDENKK